MLNKIVKPPQPPKKETSKESPVIKNVPLPPLFVKVEKYNEILKHLEELDSHINNFREVLNELNKSEEELKKRLNLTEQTLEKIAETLFILNTKIRPGGKVPKKIPEHVSHEDLLKEAEDLEDYLKTMREAMEKIKNEINR